MALGVIHGAGNATGVGLCGGGAGNGGLGERTHSSSWWRRWRFVSHRTVNQTVNQVQMWRRWLRRAQELRINVPDATSPTGALDRISQPLSKAAALSAFRSSSIRAMLMVMVDVMCLEGVERFAEALLAEGDCLPRQRKVWTDGYCESYTNDEELEELH